MALFGSVGKWLGKGLKGASKVAGFIPGVGTLAATGMGGLGELLEKGNKTNLKGLLGSAAGGALSGLGGGLVGKLGDAGKLGSLLGMGKDLLGSADGQPGVGLGDLLKVGGGILGGKQIYDASKQSKKDSAYARELAQQSLSAYQNAMTGAQERYQMNSPLRDAFRMGAFNMADPTNPFSRGNMFNQFAGNVQQESMQPMMATGQPPAPPVPGLTGMLGMGAPPTGGVPGGLQQAMSRFDMGPFASMLKPPGTTNRSASVKGGNVNAKQDRGRDQRIEDEERAY